MNPWIILVVCALTGGGAAGGYFVGYAAEAKVFKLYQLQQISSAQKAEIESQTRVRAVEQQASSNLTQISTTYQAALDDLNKRKNALVATINTRAVSGVRNAHPDTDTNRVPEIASGAPGNFDTPTGAFSNPNAEWLINLASDADAVAIQLAAAQQIIIQDRITCSGDNTPNK